MHNGVWRPNNAPVKDVRIKMLQTKATDQEKKDIRQEADTLSKFFHRNVLELFGVVDDEEKV